MPGSGAGACPNGAGAAGGGAAKGDGADGADATGAVGAAIGAMPKIVFACPPWGAAGWAAAGGGAVAGIGRPHVPQCELVERTAAPQYGQGLVGVAIESDILRYFQDKRYVPPLLRSTALDSYPPILPSILPAIRCFLVFRGVPRRLHDMRNKALTIDFNGRPVRAFEGESIAAALHAAEQPVWGRSLKYHRPRGLFCMDGHCSGCLMRIDGVPNLRACMQPCKAGSRVESQNAFPSVETDLLAAVDFLFAKGMNHHTLMTGSPLLNKATGRVVRHLSGLGELPTAIADTVEKSALLHCDVLVIGGGPAGLQAAIAASRPGNTIVLVDEGLALGGSLRTDPRFGPSFVQDLLDTAREREITLMPQTTAIAHFGEDADPVDPEQTIVSDSKRLTRIIAKATVHATGSYAQNVAFENNDRPGVIAMRAAGRLLLDYQILPAQSMCFVGRSDASEALRKALIDVGCDVHQVDPAKERIVACTGHSSVTAAIIQNTDDDIRREIPCQLIVIATTPSPASELARQQGATTTFSDEGGGFAVQVDERGQSTAPGVFACGDVCGYIGPECAMQAGRQAGRSAADYVEAT